MLYMYMYLHVYCKDNNEMGHITVYVHVGVFSALLNYVVSCCSEPDDESEQEILSKAVYVLIRAVRRNEMVCSNIVRTLMHMHTQA